MWAQHNGKKDKEHLYWYLRCCLPQKGRDCWMSRRTGVLEVWEMEGMEGQGSGQTMTKNGRTHSMN